MDLGMVMDHGETKIAFKHTQDSGEQAKSMAMANITKKGYRLTRETSKTLSRMGKVYNNSKMAIIIKAVLNPVLLMALAVIHGRTD